MADWNPRAQKVVGRDAGNFTGGKPKIVLHSTEGSTAQGAIQAFKNTGSWPHFTISPTELYQHLPISKAARALEHPAGTCETNRDRAIQIEMVGFARDTQDWPDAYLDRIRELCVWISQNAGVPLTAGVAFTSTANRQAKRLSCAGWHGYSGICGHEHVPNNSHWDPGRFPISKLLTPAKPASNTRLAAWRERLKRAKALRDVLPKASPLIPVLLAYEASLRALIRKEKG